RPHRGTSILGYRTAVNVDHSHAGSGFLGYNAATDAWYELGAYAHEPNPVVLVGRADRSGRILMFDPLEITSRPGTYVSSELRLKERWESDGYAGFRNGGAEFILQRFDDEHFAQNFMVRLNVDDLDRWWDRISQKSLDRTYPGVRFSGPTNQPWGREVNFIDLAGVCWHIGQRE